MRWNGGGLSGGSGYRYYLEGAEAFLKKGSGMFFHDVSGGRLMYAPATGAQPGVTVAARLAELVRSDAVDDVSVEQMTFEHTAADFTPCCKVLPFLNCMLRHSLLPTAANSCNLYCWRLQLRQRPPVRHRVRRIKSLRLCTGATVKM
jgi:hypothetical protein